MKLAIEHLQIADLQQKYRQTNLSKQRGYKRERQIKAAKKENNFLLIAWCSVLLNNSYLGPIQPNIFLKKHLSNKPKAEKIFGSLERVSNSRHSLVIEGFESNLRHVYGTVRTRYIMYASEIKRRGSLMTSRQVAINFFVKSLVNLYEIVAIF